MNTPITTQLPGDADVALLHAYFERALEIPEAGRDAWIAAQVNPPELRERLRRLLSADLDRGALDTSAAERAARIDSGELVPCLGMQGRRIGAFVLTRLLGEGGMATVFLGERHDGEFHQQVAVKLLRRSIYSRPELRWFRRERRVLAALSHPNIAHLLDGGVTEDGIPYLVIEYVDGIPIDRHCEVRRASVRERVQLMVEVCRAVAAAHRALVVHRDLKPANVLVDRGGRVKLLDFGIAKLLDDGSEEATRTVHRAMTPGYAAPEQYVDGPISTATDVYALGVTLHELLLGVRPDAVPGLRPSQVAATLRADETPFEPALLAAELRGDLDNILQTALAAAPEMRYASAAELADDLEAHLEARPVRAHPPSRLYRMRKFVQRHRGGVAVSALLLVGMLASLLVALWQAQLAREQAQRAGEVQAFVESLFEPLDNRTAVRQTPSLRELLERGVQRVAEHAPDNPALRADLLAMFARINYRLGEDDVAATEQAWQANRDVYGDDDERALEAHHNLARALERRGDYGAALGHYHAVVEQMRRQGIGGHLLAGALDEITNIRMQQGISNREAIAMREESLRVREADPAIEPSQLAVGYNNLGTSLQYAAEFEQALPWFQKALAINREQGHRYGVAMNLLNIGQTQGYQGRWREAAAVLAESRENFAGIHIERHASLVILLIEQCRIAGELEHWALIDESCATLVEMAREVNGENHTKYASALNRRAAGALAYGRIDDAERDFAAARAVIERIEGDRSFATELVDSVQARSWLERGDHVRLRDVMLAMLDPAREQRVQATGKLLQRAQLLLACQLAPTPGCAAHEIARVDDIMRSPAYSQHAQRLWVHSLLAEVELLRDQPGPARARLQGALRDHSDALGPQHSRVAEAELLLARALEQLGDREGAKQQRARAELIIAGLPASHRLKASTR